MRSLKTINRHALSGLAALALIAATSTTSHAQQPERSGSRGQSTPTFTVSFGGGTVLEYVKQLASENANIVISNADVLADLPLSRVDVQGVTVPTALTLLRNREWRLDDGREIRTTFSTAQDDQNAGRPIYTVEASVKPPRDPGGAPANLLNFEFSGGPVQEYIEFISEAGGVNVLVSESAASLPLPPVTLKRVSAHSAIQLLKNQRIDTPNGVWQVDINVVGGGGPEAMLYRVDADGKSRGAAQSAAAYATKTWSVADLLDGELKPDEILTAIQTVLELTEVGEHEATIRFHEATALIMVRGVLEHLAAIDDTLTMMSQTVAYRRNNAEG